MAGLEIYRRKDGGYQDQYGNEVDQETVDAYAEADRTKPWQAALGSALYTGRRIGENFGLVDRNDDLERRMAVQQDVHPVSTFLGQMGVEGAPLGKAGIVPQMLKGFGWGAATGDPDDPWYVRGGMAAAGEGAGDMASRIFKRITEFGARGDGATPETAMARQYEQTGGVLTPGQATGSQALKDLEQAMAATPGSSQILADIEAGNQLNTNRLFIEGLGLDSRQYEVVSDDVLALAEDEIGDRFANVASQLDSYTLDEATNRRLRNWVGNSATKRDVLEDITGSVFPEEGDITLTPEGILEVRSLLSEETATKGGADLRQIVSIIDRIDNHIVQRAAEIGDDIAGEYELARDQWRLLKSIDKTGAIEPGGNINPRSAFSKIRKWRDAAGDQRTFRENVQAGSSQALGVKYGNSGTAQRSKRLRDVAVSPVAKAGAKGYMAGGRAFGGLLEGDAPYLGLPGALTRGGLLARQDRTNRQLPPVGTLERIR